MKQLVIHVLAGFCQLAEHREDGLCACDECGCADSADQMHYLAERQRRFLAAAMSQLDHVFIWRRS